MGSVDGRVAVAAGGASAATRMQRTCCAHPDPCMLLLPPDQLCRIVPGVSPHADHAPSPPPTQTSLTPNHSLPAAPSDQLCRVVAGVSPHADHALVWGERLHARAVQRALRRVQGKRGNRHAAPRRWVLCVECFCWVVWWGRRAHDSSKDGPISAVSLKIIYIYLYIYCLAARVPCTQRRMSRQLPGTWWSWCATCGWWHGTLAALCL
jgi:hypothetical protein